MENIYENCFSTFELSIEAEGQLPMKSHLMVKECAHSQIKRFQGVIKRTKSSISQMKESPTR